MDIRARVFTSVEVEFVAFHFALFQREDTGIFPGFLFNARVSLIYDTCFLPKPRSLCHCVDTLHIYQRSPAPPNPSGKTRTCPRDTFGMLGRHGDGQEGESHHVPGIIQMHTQTLILVDFC